MNTEQILYVECLPDRQHDLAFDFCYSAKLGAEAEGIKIIPFVNYIKIPYSVNAIVVGCVESCVGWLMFNEIKIPQAIDLLGFDRYLGRNVRVVDISDLDVFPIFIKPTTQIKAFTGFVCHSKEEIKLLTYDYVGEVYAQEVLNVKSEYRLYVSEGEIIGMKHYSGNPLIFPNRYFIEECLKFAKSILMQVSFTLDFGVTVNGRTFLIEANDGWAIGNYGLHPYDYFDFVRKRWLQITNG